MAQKIFVIEIYARDDGNSGRENVRGVETAAEADLENAEFDAFAREAFEGHGRDAFEIRGMRTELVHGEQLLDQRLQASENSGEGLIADFFAVHADAFVDSFEMRRGIQAGSKACRAEDGFEERRGRAFAVCPRNVRAGISAIGAAEPFSEHGDVFQIELRGGCLRGCSQFPSQSQKIANRRFVIHFSPRGGRGSWR